MNNVNIYTTVHILKRNSFIRMDEYYNYKTQSLQAFQTLNKQFQITQNP
jgi:hypothetical protein